MGTCPELVCTCMACSQRLWADIPALLDMLVFGVDRFWALTSDAAGEDLILTPPFPVSERRSSGEYVIKNYTFDVQTDNGSHLV